jgi:putative transposase
MVGFIDENREEYGVEPICKSLPIALSTYRLYKAREADPELEPDRTRRDRILKREIQQFWDDNRKVYGARKVWKVLRNEKHLQVARCTC